MVVKFFILLIVAVVLISGCTQVIENVGETELTNGTESMDSVDSASGPKKCTDQEASGTEEEIDNFIDRGVCINSTKHEGLYPYSLEQLGSSKEIYTSGFCCTLQNQGIPGQDY